MKLIIGLGNPGKKYERTRHNAGFIAVRAFSAAHGEVFLDWKEKFNAEICEGRIGREKIVLLLPQTFMNLSGDSVAAAAAFWKVSPEDVMVAYDDVDIPLGKIRIRAEGSAGGHNGIKSLIERLGTKSFPRIRIGVGTELSKDIPSEDWVLGKFAKDEEAPLRAVVETTVHALDEWLSGGLAAAQNKYGK
jgi:PTH1 family peptidyl-tRNA hydrolase